MSAVFMREIALICAIRKNRFKQGNQMAKPNYSYEKRQKELAKKKKQEEKRKRRQAAKGEAKKQPE